ncbi:hypothetical protein Csa_005087 [Cucumis sativus]|nr:hypothetical protein Csa_005087 [Cucumis sativus]
MLKRRRIINELVLMVECLATLGSHPHEFASAVAQFPYMLFHSMEDKLCPRLAFFQALDIPEKLLGKMILLNPRLIRYSIVPKLTEIVDFHANFGLDKQGLIDKVLVKYPFLMGYSVDKTLRPTLKFFKSIGLKDVDLQAIAGGYPEVLCRDANKVLTPNFDFLKNCGFRDAQIVALVAGYPPILIKSIEHSIEPQINFLIELKKLLVIRTSFDMV